MSNYSKNPEDLHTPLSVTEKVTDGKFVNKGMPASPLVKLEDRKTGIISDAANSALRANMMNGDPSQITSFPSKGNEGSIPAGQ